MVNLRQEYGRTVRERDAAQAAWLETLQGDSDEAVRKPFLEWQRLEMLVKFLEATYPWLLDLYGGEAQGGELLNYSVEVHP